MTTYFFFQPHENSGLHSLRPFLSLESQSGDLEDEPDNLFRIHPNPKILALGILLLEIHLATTIQSLRCEEDLGEDGNATINTDHFTAMRLFEETADEFYFNTSKAISACLKCDFYDAEISELNFQNSNFRNAVYKNIVEPLEMGLDAGYGIKPADLGFNYDQFTHQSMPALAVHSPNRPRSEQEIYESVADPLNSKSEDEHNVKLVRQIPLLPSLPGAVDWGQPGNISQPHPNLVEPWRVIPSTPDPTVDTCSEIQPWSWSTMPLNDIQLPSPTPSFNATSQYYSPAQTTAPIPTLPLPSVLATGPLVSESSICAVLETAGQEYMSPQPVCISSGVFAC